MFNDFVENVEEGIERGLEIIEDGFRYVWENLILKLISDLKDNYFHPARNFVEQFLNEGSGNIESFNELVFSILDDNLVNNTINGFTDSFSTLTDIIPINDLTDLLNNYIGKFSDGLSYISGAFNFIREVLSKLGTLAFEILIDVFRRSIIGFLESKIDYLQNIFLGLDNIIENLFKDSGIINVVNSIQIDVNNPIEGTLFQPLSVLSSIQQFYDNSTQLKTVLNYGLSKIERSGIFKQFLTSFFTENGIFNGRAVILRILPNLLSIISILTDILTSNSNNTNFIQLSKMENLNSILSFDNNEDARVNIARINTFHLVFDTLGELISQYRKFGTTKKDQNGNEEFVKFSATQKAGFSFIKTGISLFGKYLADIKADILEDEFGLTDQSHNYVQGEQFVTYIESSLTLIKDVIGIFKGDDPHNPSYGIASLFITGIELASSIIEHNKWKKDLQTNINQMRKYEDEFVRSAIIVNYGYSASFLEHFVKWIDKSIDFGKGLGSLLEYYFAPVGLENVGTVIIDALSHINRKIFNLKWRLIVFLTFDNLEDLFANNINNYLNPNINAYMFGNPFDIIHLLG